MYASKYSVNTLGTLIHDELMYNGSVIISFKDVPYFDSDVFVNYLFKQPLNQKVYTYVFRHLHIIECTNSVYRRIMDSILDYMIKEGCDKNIFDDFNNFRILNAPFSLSKIVNYPNYKIIVNDNFIIKSASIKDNTIILSCDIDGEYFDNLKIKDLSLDVAYMEYDKKIVSFDVDVIKKVINLYTDQEEV